MKLRPALELAKELNMTTIEEAMHNIVMHSSNFFPYSEVETEIGELMDDFKKYDFPNKMRIVDALNFI